MPLPVDITDDVKRGLSGFNKCALVGALVDADMTATTFQALYDAAAAKPLLTANTELRQARDMLGLRGLQAGSNEAVLTDAALPPTPATIVGGQQLFVNQDNRLPLNYQGSCPQ